MAADPRPVKHDYTDTVALADALGTTGSGASCETRLVVAAFDPHQLDKTLADDDLDSFLRSSDSEVFWLQDCYRQKENVGQAAKQVWDAIAAKTPYRRQDRREDFRTRHRRVTERVNELRFRNPLGYTQIYEKAPHELLTQEVQRAFETGRFIQHWPTILIVVEGPGPYQELPQGELPFSIALCGFNEVESVKGLEFPHVLVVISEATYVDLLRTDNGPGKNEYGNQRLLRIPFSRARDGLVTFVVEQGSHPAVWLREWVRAAGTTSAHTTTEFQPEVDGAEGMNELQSRRRDGLHNWVTNKCPARPRCDASSRQRLLAADLREVSIGGSQTHLWRRGCYVPSPPDDS